MPREIDDLEAHAVKFWPTTLSQREQTASIIPKLIESQEKFIALLYVADATPTAWKTVLQEKASMPGNLFLKHLMVLSDVSGEKLQRYRTELGNFFPTRFMTFHWKDAEHIYTFRSTESWNNNSLQVDGPALANSVDLSVAMEDVAMLLIHGGASVHPGLPDDLLEKCIIGSLIGRNRELDSFVRQRYIVAGRRTEEDRDGKYPDKEWVMTELAHNPYRPYCGVILDSFVVGSEAKGTAKPNSDLDVAVVIPRRTGSSASQFSDRWNSAQQTDTHFWNGRKVDFQFFYPDDPELSWYSKIPLNTKASD